MRRWYYPGEGPNGEPIAPSQSDSATMHDTVMDLPLGGNQSDKIPQPIRLRLYHRRTGGGIIYKIHKFPHPVLCGPNGRIEYLPDHMHEGLCEVPANLSNVWNFDGYHSTEYPLTPTGREEPEVIAWATTRNTNGSEFGVLAAYNGHVARVGRVVVDATWHHWFNINLTGLIDATTPGSPTYDPAVVPKWDDIKAYYRNVGLWLAHPRLHRCLRNGAWIRILKYYDIMITFRPLDRVVDRLTYYWQLGVFARDAMGRFASQCQTTHWALESINWLEVQLFPWPPTGTKPFPDPPPWLDVTELENVALGGAVHELMTRFRYEQDAQLLVEQRGEEIEQLVERGAAAGVAELLQRFESGGHEAARLLQIVNAHR
jgi:hypothetical protein